MNKKLYTTCFLLGSFGNSLHSMNAGKSITLSDDDIQRQVQMVRHRFPSLQTESEIASAENLLAKAFKNSERLDLSSREKLNVWAILPLQEKIEEAKKALEEKRQAELNLLLDNASRGVMSVALDISENEGEASNRLAIAETKKSWCTVS